MMMKVSTSQGYDIPTVAIVGRPNVGKSALFNRILRRRLAIVHEEEGVTRDRITAVSSWFDKPFLLVDTGGLGFYRKDRIPTAMDGLIRHQLDIAIENADKIVLVVDVKAGILPLDQEISHLLRESQKDVIVAVNKADNQSFEDLAFAFIKLGFEKIVPISCLHSHNIGDLLDEITATFAKKSTEAYDTAGQNPTIAVVGRPNVGKSSIINCFLSNERVIVSEVAGTTRDAIEIPVHLEVDNSCRTINLIDTAGLRPNRNIKSPVEYFSMIRTKAAIKGSDLVLVVLDATTPIKNVDKKICRLVINERKPCILVANKWDIACKKVKQKELLKYIQESLHFLDYSPLLTCCALSGYNFKSLINCIFDLYQQMQIKMPTALVNKVIEDILARHQPISCGRSALKIYYGVHIHHSPPTFLLFVNKVSRCSENDLKSIKKHMRKAFGLSGLPIHITLRERE